MSKDEVPEESFSSDEEFDEEDDSESSSDVDAKLAEDDVFDIEFFKCYSALKKRDDKIYDKNVKFFSEEISSNSENDDDKDDGDSYKQGAKRLMGLCKRSGGPKMTLLDHQLNFKDEEYDSCELERVSKIDLNQTVSKSFYEKELDEIKKSIEKVSENIDSESDDDLLVIKSSEAGTSKPKSRKTIDAMLDKLENDDNQEIIHLKKVWSNPDELTEEEKYLRDYILNKRYIPATADENKDGNDDGDGGFFSKNLDDMSDVEEDDKQEAMKKKHNFDHHSDEKDFDRITRVPRNSTKTIRDLAEKRERKEKRLKKLEKEKKRKKAIKNADFEDLVGDLPTKFHYRETEPNDYGLSAEELLMATDEELEKWVSLKDTIGYRSREEELREKKKFDQKRNDFEFKKKIFKSIYGDPEQVNSIKNSNIETSSEKQSYRPKTEVDGVCSGLETSQVDDIQAPNQEKNSSIDSQIGNTNKKKKKHKRGLSHKKHANSGVAPDRLLSYGLSKTKLKKSKLL